MALETDRELIRTFASRLAEDGPQARSAFKALVADGPPEPGRILAALRRSSPVGADLDFRDRVSMGTGSTLDGLPV